MPIPTCGRFCGWAVLSGVAFGLTASPILARPAAGSAADEGAQERLTLETAIRRALAATPLSAVASARRESLNAAREAAGMKPQPTVEVMVENFGPPMGDLYDQFQITGTYSQRFERRGKRQARVRVASREIDVAEAEAIVARLDLIKTVQQGFAEVQAAQAKIIVARDRLSIAKQLQAEVARRVASAKDPIFAGTRARAAAAEADVNLELAIHAREAALKRLASFWGGNGAVAIAGTADFVGVMPEPATLAPSSADLALAETRLARAEAAVDVQRANARADRTLFAGPRIIGTGAIGAVAGVSMPLGGKRIARARVAEATAETRRLAAELAVERNRLERAIALAAERVNENRREAQAIRDEVVPSAERTLEQVRFGYNRGFFNFTDVSAAQTVLASARERVIEAARRYQEARADLDRLTGRFTDLAREGM